MKAAGPAASALSAKIVGGATPPRLTALVLALAATCSLPIAAAPDPTTVSGRAMGTTWSAQWRAPAAAIDPAAVKEALAGCLEALEQQFSTYREGSEVSHFNRTRHTEWFPVSADLARAAMLAREISARTGDAFDPTIAPLLRTWGIGPHPARDTWPTAAERAAARAQVDWRRLEVRTDPPALRKADPHLQVELASLAKGYAVDRLSALLNRLGAPHHLVRIGGDFRAAGPGPREEGWRVAIEDPLNPGGKPACVVTLRNEALSTSGNYRNALQIGGQAVGHILDPRSGLPVSGSLWSVSVRAGTCAESSALATALFVLGAEEGRRLAARESIAAVFLLRDGPHLRQHASPAFGACGR